MACGQGKLKNKVVKTHVIQFPSGLGFCFDMSSLIRNVAKKGHVS